MKYDEKFSIRGIPGRIAVLFSTSVKILKLHKSF